MLEPRLHQDLMQMLVEAATNKQTEKERVKKNKLKLKFKLSKQSQEPVNRRFVVNLSSKELTDN